MATDDRELDRAAALGAESEASTQILSPYIPNKDRHGRPIRIAPWIREAQEILTRIGEGYTTTPPHDGGWETGRGQVRREKTVIVYPYIKPDRFLAHVAALREFLHRFGRDTHQEVVVVEPSGAEGSWFFRIKQYDDWRRQVWQPNSSSRVGLLARSDMLVLRSARSALT